MIYKQTRLELLHQVTTAANLACVFSASLLMVHEFSMRLLAYEWSLLMRLGFLRPHERYMGGYLAFVILTLILTFCLWFFLRLVSGAKLTRRFLLAPAGLLALSAYPTWVIYFVFSSARPQRFGWDPWFAVTTCETVIVSFIALILSRTTKMDRALPILVVLHAAFWGWYYGLDSAWYVSNVGLPVLMCASLVWSLYVWQQNRRFLVSQPN